MNIFLLPPWQPPQLCLSRAVSCRLPPLSSFAFPFLLSASPLTWVGMALEEKGQGHQRLCMRTSSCAHTHNKWIQGQGGKPINHASYHWGDGEWRVLEEPGHKWALGPLQTLCFFPHSEQRQKIKRIHPPVPRTHNTSKKEKVNIYNYIQLFQNVNKINKIHALSYRKTTQT